MTTTLPTRAAIDAAEPLSFDRKQKQELTITIKARVDGFDVDICYSGSIETLSQVTQRLRALGAEPVSGGQTKGISTNDTLSAQHANRKAERVTPEYDQAGNPLCPKHHKPLREGKFGLYCPAKDDGTERGYCSIKFAG